MIEIRVATSLLFRPLVNLFEDLQCKIEFNIFVKFLSRWGMLEALGTSRNLEKKTIYCYTQYVHLPLSEHLTFYSSSLQSTVEVYDPPRLGEYSNYARIILK